MLKRCQGKAAEYVAEWLHIYPSVSDEKADACCAYSKEPLLPPLLPLFLSGPIGIAIIPFGFALLLQAYETMPELQHIPPAHFILPSLAQPLLLLTIGSALGAALEYLLFKPDLREFFDAVAQRQPRDFAMTIPGVLYGGMTDEVTPRWGLMSLFIWGHGKPSGTSTRNPEPARL